MVAGTSGKHPTQIKRSEKALNGTRPARLISAAQVPCSRLQSHCLPVTNNVHHPKSSCPLSVPPRADPALHFGSCGAALGDQTPRPLRILRAYGQDFLKSAAPACTHLWLFRGTLLNLMNFGVQLIGGPILCRHLTSVSAGDSSYAYGEGKAISTSYLNKSPLGPIICKGRRSPSRP